MTTKPVVPRAATGRGVDDVISHYLADGARPAALEFIDALEAAYKHVSRHPASGSPRYGQELNLPGLRCWRLKRCPHIVFDTEREDRIDVWRVLHGMRDIASWLREADDASPS